MDPARDALERGGGPCVTFHRVAVSLRGPGQSPVLPVLRRVAAFCQPSSWRTGVVLVGAGTVQCLATFPQHWKRSNPLKVCRTLRDCFARRDRYTIPVFGQLPSYGCGFCKHPPSRSSEVLQANVCFLGRACQDRKAQGSGPTGPPAQPTACHWGWLARDVHTGGGGLSYVRHRPSKPPLFPHFFLRRVVWALTPEGLWSIPHRKHLRLTTIQASPLAWRPCGCCWGCRVSLCLQQEGGSSVCQGRADLRHQQHARTACTPRRA